MKKIIACISLVFAMSAGVTALADYEATDNSYSVDATNYTTVLIEKGADIVYVNQNDSGLGSAAKFLIKGEKLEDGTYTVKLGGATNGETLESTFTVTSVVPVAKPLEAQNKAPNGDNFDYGFFGTVKANDCKYIAITVTKGQDTKTGYYETTFNASGEGDVNAAVRINGVPDGYDVSVALTNVNN